MEQRCRALSIRDRIVALSYASSIRTIAARAPGTSIAIRHPTAEAVATTFPFAGAQADPERLSVTVSVKAGCTPPL